MFLSCFLGLVRNKLPKRMGRNKDRDQEKEKSLHEKDDAKQKDEPPPPKRKKVDENATLTTKTGGAYIPPAKLRMMQEQMTDKTR